MSTISKIRQSDIFTNCLATLTRAGDLAKRQPRRENLERDQAPRRETVR